MAQAPNAVPRKVRRRKVPRIWWYSEIFDFTISTPEGSPMPFADFLPNSDSFEGLVAEAAGDSRKT
jgi:hypothetical protein